LITDQNAKRDKNGNFFYIPESSSDEVNGDLFQETFGNNPCGKVSTLYRLTEFMLYAYL
jgi:hypothetical protein